MTASGSERCFSDQQQTAGPHDPNEKQVVNARFIRPDELLVYPIHFENTGNAEARDVFVTDVLDANLDPSTVNLITPNGGSFDSATRTVKWSLLSRNLQPGQTGNVLVAARPRPGLPAGTEIRNKAVIQFEVFDPMTTNEVVNIIDDVAPHCAVTPLPGEISAPAFTVSWTGTDAVGEVDSYSVWVSTDGSAFTALLENTKDTGTTFQGAPGKRYGFLCVAKDTAGNIEIKGAVAETSTTVALNFAPTANAGVNRTVRVGSPVTLHGEGSSDADSGPQPLMFSWSQVSGPSVVLSGPSTSNPTFTPTTAGSYVFRLTVSDGIASSGPADVAITVPKLGDIDGDGAVDNSDLSLILAARNTSASGPNDLRDLDGDGMITALDARKLTTLCTRPRCAVQ